MTTQSRNARYRARRIAKGAKAIWLMLRPDAIQELDARCSYAGLSRPQLIERWLLEEKSSSVEKEA